MNVRENSIKAYNEIKENGMLSQILWDIYDVFWHHGPLTSRQANEIYCRTLKKANNLNQFRSKVTILKDRKVLKETEDVKCEVTGMTVAVYDVTSGLPEKPEQEMTRKGRIKEIKKLLDELEREINPFHRARVTTIYNHVCKL